MKKNIILFFFSVIVCLFVLELFCRWSGKYQGYSEKTGVAGFQSPFVAYDSSWYYNTRPNNHIFIQQHEFRLDWITNNEGFRDTTFTIHKDKIRIMAIGDSFTQGVGADNDSSLPRQLGYILRDNFHLPSEIWNCGLAGSDLVYEFKLFHDKLLKYDPDMILLVINSSDFNDVITKGGFERFLPDSTVQYRPAPWFMPLYIHSYLARRVVHDIFKYNWQYLSPAQVGPAEQRALTTLTGAIDSFTQLCAQRNIKLLVAINPTRGEFDNTVKNESLPLLSYCRRRNLPVVDVKTELYKMGWDSVHVSSLYWPEDGHFRNLGYHYFAKTVWPQMAAMLDK